MQDTFNPFTRKPDFIGNGGSSSYISEGTGGIDTIRWVSSGGFVYDMTIDDGGNIVMALVSSPGLPTTGFLQEGSSDFIMLETGDYLLQES